MQLKVESENYTDRNCTSSIYISQASQNVVNNAIAKPVLTIQVNQNSTESANNSSSNDLVNIVSCFRAHPAVNGIENGSSTSVANVSVNDELVNNENNQNIVNIECRQLRSEDLNEISVDVSATNANSNVDYQNMALDSTSNRDRVGLIRIESGKNENSTNENQNDSNVVKDSQQREQRRRERRERRQARQRTAQQSHRHHQIAVHQRLVTNNRGGNGVEQSSRASYEMLPDIINNHLPPPYTTLPLHQIPPLPSVSAMHSPPIIAAPVPVVVDDCRFSFPIPIIRR